MWWPFSRNTPPSSASEPDIPSYPPVSKGLPFASPDQLLTPQAELLSQTRGSVKAGFAHYDEFYQPIIQRYAAIVHLLPASASHHHRGAGGLLRHGLETGCNALRLSERVVFGLDEYPSVRRKVQPRWELALFIAALGHDLGKCISDMAVTDQEGKLTWNPFEADLFAWGQAARLDRYFLRWRPTRIHGQHAPLSIMLMDQLLDTKTRTFLFEVERPEILEQMLTAMTSCGAVRPEELVLTRLVKQADKMSVEADMREARVNAVGYGGAVPVEQHIIDAMRRLFETGRWKINVPGGRGFVVEGALFLVWPQASREIIDLLAEDNIPGIPRDPDSMAKVLFERGLIDRAGEFGFLWKVLVQGVMEQDVELTAILIANPDLVIYPMPQAVGGEAWPFAEQRAAKEAPKPSPGKAAGKKGAKNETGRAVSAPAGLTPAPEQPSQTAPKAEPACSEDRSAVMVEPDPSTGPWEPCPGAGKHQEAPSQAIAQEEAAPIFYAGTPVEDLFIDLTLSLKNGRLVAGQDYEIVDGCLRLAHPRWLSTMGREKELGEIMRFLREQSWTQRDPLTPELPILKVDNQAYLQFRYNYGEALIRLVPKPNTPPTAYEHNNERAVIQSKILEYILMNAGNIDNDLFEINTLVRILAKHLQCSISKIHHEIQHMEELEKNCVDNITYISLRNHHG